MNIEARKIKFIQEFLKLESEESISKLEKILQEEKNASDKRVLKPMSIEELNKRIDQSESDFKNNRFKTGSELISKYK